MMSFSAVHTRWRILLAALLGVVSFFACCLTAWADSGAASSSAAAATPSIADSDPMVVLQRANLWHITNATDAELREYADDAVITLSPPPPAPGRATYEGKQQVREYLVWSRQEAAPSTSNSVVVRLKNLATRSRSTGRSR